MGEAMRARLPPAPRVAGMTGLAVLAVLVTVVTVWVTSGQHRPLPERADEVASGLRCPTCTAVSVADSNSPIAQSMRTQIRAQLRAGRSPEQVRRWFAERYGDQVLLSPPAEGLGLTLWVFPALALTGGLVVTGKALRRPAFRGVTSGGSGPTAVPPAKVALAGVALLCVGVAVPATVGLATARPSTVTAAGGPAGDRAGPAEPTGAREWLAAASSLEQQGAYGQASRAYRHVLRQRPQSPAVRVRLALVLLRARRPQQAPPLVRDLAARPGPHRADALLVLGLAQRAAGREQGGQSLRSFLRLAPEHPAAQQVRRLLGDGS
jgi:cytochrome c-type biogenesis protein CcmH